ncbi:putative folylpolyglutamate synthase [Ditylenchus destructor]|nr:putative folylpolyglutamate synthase [Ditylenchus destructor]
MSTKSFRTYEDAIFELNSLQSNAETLAKSQSDGRKMSETNVSGTSKFLAFLGLNASHIDSLNCIHITGTKGKGSTAAFVESILRNLGFKTGFYRERIRINGKSLSEEEFTNHFFDVLDTIKKQKSPTTDLPGYFKFLTLLAFKVFHLKRVDVAIIEVGIGGEYDCTNVIENPVVCGITSLDLDHTKLLGSTISEIAWQKAGIMKNNSLLLTVNQSLQAMEVIQERSLERNCPFLVVPEINEYDWPKADVRFGIPGKHQMSNVSLALQIARFWLLRSSKLDSCSIFMNHTADLKGQALNHNQLAYKVPEVFVEALEKCTWPGRSQILREGNITYFIDGAHTPKSLQYCADWFTENSARLEKCMSVRPLKVLIFHCSGDRDSATLLPFLKDCGIDVALFTPSILKAVSDKHMDNTNFNQSENAEMKKCSVDIEKWNDIVPNKQALAFNCIEETLSHLKQLAHNNSELHVLVTGSLYLVGGVLFFEKPNIAD